MLITSRAEPSVGGNVRTRGVMGHATSLNLLDWTVQPPLSQPHQGFGQLEVYQFEIVDGVPIVVFCCGWRELSSERLAEFGERDATYSVACNADLTGLDFGRARAFEERLAYAARIIQDRSGGWNLIGFDNFDENGEFLGRLCDPVPVTADPAIGLVTR